MKKYIILLLTLFCIQSTQAQVDSLIQMLPNDMEDSVKIQLYDDICWELIYQDPTLMKEYADSMYDFARRIENQKGIARAILNQGNSFMVLGQFQEANPYFLRAYDLSSKIKFLDGQKASISSMATVKMQLSDFQSADSLLIVLDGILELLQDTVTIISNCINRSMLLGQQGKYDEAIGSLLKADKLDAIKDWGEPSVGISLSANLGALYTEIGDVDKALRFYKKSIEKARAVNHHFLHPTLVNLSNLFIDQDQLDSASIYLSQVDTIKLSTKSKYYYFADLGKIEEKTGKSSAALRNYQLALNEAKKGGFLIEEGVAYGQIGTYFVRRGAMQEAYDASKKAVDIFRSTGTMQSSPYKETLKNLLLAESYLENTVNYSDLAEFMTLNDSILSVEKINALSELESKYEDEKKQFKIDYLEKEQTLKERTISTQRKNLIIALTGLGLITLLSFFLYRNRNNLKKLNHQLIDQKNQIQLLNREMNHRVKNNLAFMTGLLEMQGRRLENVDAREALRESEGRLRALSLVHSSLFKEDGKQSLNIRQYLDQMLQNLQTIFEHPGKSLKIKTDIAEMELPPEQTMRIGLIINELVTNSIKHAFIAVDEPEINLSVYQDDEKGLVLLYQDNGPGITEKILQEKKDSLGLKLIRLLTEQLNGKMHLAHPGISIELAV